MNDDDPQPAAIPQEPTHPLDLPPALKDDEDRLTDKQRKYVERLAAGMDSKAAALAAGYSKSYAKVAGRRLGGKPAIANAIAAIRKKGCEMAAYGLVEAMKEAEDAAAFARLHNSPMANVKAAELRAKLAGLLVEKVEVVSVDLTKALAAAEARVLHTVDITPRPLNGGLIQAADSTFYNGPGRPGDPFFTE